MKLPANIKDGFSFSAILLLVIIFYSCDSLEDDAMPQGPKVSVEGGDLYLMADGTAYIDLFSKIKTNGTVTLDIASLPRKGILTEIAPGFLRYTPDKLFKSGRDRFSFAVLGENNRLLKTDSIELVVKDSVDLPCGLYPNDDWASLTATTIDVNVLFNDYICGDSADVHLEVYKPGNNFPPFNGTAEVTPENLIRYTAHVEDATDTIVYKISMISNPAVVAFATLYISVDNNCDPYLDEITATYLPPLETVYPHYDSLYISLIDNEERCGMIYSNLSITRAPENPVRLHHPGVYYYFTLQDSTVNIIDSLGYRLCNGQDCLDGRVNIKIN